MATCRGRTLPIFVAVILIIAAAFAAAWFALDRAPSNRSEGSARSQRSERSDRSGTKVLAARIDAPNTTTTAPTTALPTSTTTSTTAPISATGRFVSAATTGEVRGTGPVRTYSVEAEDGSGIDPGQLADVIDVILADHRGWTAEGHAFQRVPTGGGFTISLATPATADAICQPLDTAGRFSCHEGHRVVLNLTRWNEGTADLPLDLDEYRAQVVNHEVGHELGLGHLGCDGSGLRAPVMMQQSKGLDGCTANPWPTLDGA